MARLPRLMFAGQAHHLLQLGNDQQPIFRDDLDRLQFLHFLHAASRQFHVAIHAYVLMPNQWQLLATPSEESSLSRMVQWLGRYYVPWFNRKYARTGTLFQGRFKAAVLESGPYVTACCRYIETSPMLDGLVGSPADFRWSSYGHHAGIKPDPLITDHLTYWAMGNTPFQREAAYKNLLLQPMDAAEFNVVKLAIQKGDVLGSPQFKLELGKLAGRNLERGKRGRPAKPSGAEAIDTLAASPKKRADA